MISLNELPNDELSFSRSIVPSSNKKHQKEKVFQICKKKLLFEFNGDINFVFQ